MNAYIGTALLTAVDDARILLSAAHVLREKPKDGTALCVPTGPETCADIVGDIALLDDGHDLDVGAVRLTQTFASRVASVGYEVLRMAVALPIRPDRVSDGGYVVFGYPAALARADGDGTLVRGRATWAPSHTAARPTCSRSSTRRSTRCLPSSATR